MEIRLNEKTYELPKRTPKIAKLFDDLNGETSDVEMHYKSIAIIEAVLGKTSIKEIFGTSDRDQISVIDSVITAKKIDDIYLEPLREYEMQRQSEEMNSPSFSALHEMLENVAKLESLK